MPAQTLKFSVATGELTIAPSGTFNVTQKLTRLTVLGAANATAVQVGGASASNFTFDPTLRKLVVEGLSLDLNEAQTVTWS
jgi:alpha-glucosidase